MQSPVHLLFTLLFCPVLLFTQGVAPGGVTGPVLWGKTENTDKGVVFRVQTRAGISDFSLESAATAAAAQWFNFNPALGFDGLRARLRLPLGQQDLGKMTVFTVLWPADSTSEKSVWYLEKNSHNYLMLTSHRVADLETVSFMNFPDGRKDFPLISTYEQCKAGDTIPIAGQNLVLGAKPPAPDVPVVPFHGKLAELIVFDRVLLPDERQRVESYLGIKYGVPLDPAGPFAYLNAAGKVIRNNRKWSGFQHRVAGIGRDDASGLHQKQSATACDPELLVIGAAPVAASNAQNTTSLSDNTFLLWSDNNAPLRLPGKTNSQPRLLARQWLMTTFGSVQHLASSLRFDTRRTDWDWRDESAWWLAIDRSGTGQFPAGQTDYVAGVADERGTAVFENVRWDADGSGSDVFTFGPGPVMFAKYDVTPPRCAPPSNGQLQLGAEGGKLPYAFAVKGLNMNFDKKWIAYHNRLSTLEDIQSGDYTLTVTDATGQIFRDSLFVQSADAPVPNLAKYYTLSPGQSLRLDAAQGLESAAGATFLWSGPQGFQSTAAEVLIMQPGVYRLSVERDGCTARQEIEVGQAPAEPFRHLELFPNPAPGGRFSLLIDLFAPETVDIRIADAAGQAIAEKRLSGSDRYLLPMQITGGAGVYQVAVFTKQGARTLPVAVSDGSRQ